MANMLRSTSLLVLLAVSDALYTNKSSLREWTLRAGPSGCTTGDNHFDYLLLVAQWPATQKSSTWPAGADINDFTLHGLWPSRTGADVNSYPCTCTSETFDASKESTIMSEMEAHWPSYTGQNGQFWGHEWSKHGTCCDKTAGLSDQLSFFTGALKYREQAGFLAAFTKAGITPGGSYSYGNMSQAFKAANGVAPLMGCKTGNTLSEIGVCVDTATKKFMECDSSVQHQSGDEVSDCDQSVQVKFPAASGPSPPSPPGSGTCKDYGCGKFIAGNPCQCYDQCKQYDECCPDYTSTCGAPSPSPPATKCVSGEHGPACSSDSDCSSLPSCVRCASSGFCTCADKSTGKCA